MPLWTTVEGADDNLAGSELLTLLVGKVGNVLDRCLAGKFESAVTDNGILLLNARDDGVLAGIVAALAGNEEEFIIVNDEVAVVVKRVGQTSEYPFVIDTPLLGASNKAGWALVAVVERLSVSKFSCENGYWSVVVTAASLGSCGNDREDDLRLPFDAKKKIYRSLYKKFSSYSYILVSS